MSRRKQSNPKSLKSDSETTSQLESSSTSGTNSETMSDTTAKQTKSGDEWESDKESLSSENSNTLRENLRKSDQSVSPEPKCSQMASSDRPSSSGSPVAFPSVSFADLPKAIASNSYLAAALKASVVTSSASPSPGTLSDPAIKREVFSPSKLAESFAASSLLNSSSLSEAALSAATLTSSLLKNTDPSHLSSMLQGIPLLSSVLPALQRLVPVSLPSMPPTGGPSSIGGITCVCGVKFNGSSNLEAHRMFYCSHRQGSSDSRNDSKEDSRSPQRDHDEEESSRTLKCPHCPYTTTHKLSLNGHMNIHTSPEETQSTPAFAASIDPKAQERYCSDCDIQFSSMKTFKVHKAHYCQTRHVLKGSKSPVREDHSAQHMNIPNLNSLSSIVSALSGGTNPVIAVPTNPVLLLPLSFLIGAHVLPSQVLSQTSPAFVLPNGQVHPITSASSSSVAASIPPPPLLSPGAVASAAALAGVAGTPLSAPSQTVSPSAKSDSSYRSKSPREDESQSRKRRNDGESPLDLTTKRPKLSSKGDSDEEKENRETNNSISVRSPSSMKSHFGGGEFEGKLLASPPRLSPLPEEDRSPSGRSPRPASSLCSVASESPRPSTSAVSNSSRSPGHTSPITSSVTQGLSSLVGFSNPLVSSLESLGGNLPLASLQCLQSLQNVPRELALKLISPELLMNGLPPPPVINAPHVVVKQGPKCAECNIVFYKEESLQVHKKHYCQSRGKKTSSEESAEPSERSPSGRSDPAGSPLQSPGRDTASVPPPQAVTPKEKPLKALLQFVCTACGIKFSSPDNLTAHQTFYCTKREGAAEEKAVGKGIWRCPRCRVVMAETMQAAHQCVTPTPAPSHGWKCPCCPVLSPTAAAAQKHLETHAGIKAFRCTICGYRGNTLRGMRTHIRMHFEKRTSDLQEENFIACILEDDEPRGGGRSCSSSDTRKLLDSTRLLLETSALSSLLGADSSLQDHGGDSSFSCSFCPFVTSVRTTLLQHMTVAHNVGLESKLSMEIKNYLEARASRAAEQKSENSNGKDVENGARDNSSPPVPSIKLEPEIKLEVGDSEEERERSPEPSRKSPNSVKTPKSSPPISSSNGVCYCQICNISFSLLDSYVAHKKFYCTRPESNTPPETTVQ